MPSPSAISSGQSGSYGIANKISVLAQAGTYGIGNSVVGGSAHSGLYRVQNNIAGYNVWVGIGSLPDLTQPPTLLSATLPISVPLTPPISGTQTFYILVTAQDHYGLNSQNQQYTVFTIDSTGGLFKPDIVAPQALSLWPQSGGAIRIMATYPAASSDAFPADVWRIWIDTVMPNPMMTPTLTTGVNGRNLIINSAEQSPGTYYVMVALFRSSDSFQSPAIVAQVVVPTGPPEVAAVPSGFDLP